MISSVLIVDDDAQFRGLAVRTLSSWGFSVIAEAGTVQEAIERSVELRPDAVLVDVGLPDGDGVSLAKRLSALDWQPRIVLISSDAEAVDSAEARRVGAAGFVPKEELAGATLRRLIGGD